MNDDNKQVTDGGQFCLIKVCSDCKEWTQMWHECKLGCSKDPNNTCPKWRPRKSK